MVQTLVAICTKMSDSSARRAALSSILADAVLTWTSPEVQRIFSTRETLLEACFARSPLLSQGLESLQIFHAACKKIPLPHLPDEVWTHNHPGSTDSPPLPTSPQCQCSGMSRADLLRIPISLYLDSAPLWEQILPGVIIATRSVHGIWDPSFRLRYQRHQLPGRGAHNANRDEDMLSVLTIYLPHLSDVTSAVRCITQTQPSVDAEGEGEAEWKVDEAKGLSDRVRNKLSETRTLLYSILGMAATHKVLFFPPNLGEMPLAPSLLSSIATHIRDVLTFIDNRHIMILLKLFVEPFVINAPPACYHEVILLLEPLLGHMVDRLRCAWLPASTAMQLVSNSTDDVQAYFVFLYKLSSIPADFEAHLGVEGLDTARDTAVIGLTRVYADFLGVLSLKRGFLALAPKELANKKQLMKQRYASQTQPQGNTSMEGNQMKEMDVGMEDDNPRANKSLASLPEAEQELDADLGSKGSPQVLQARRDAVVGLVLGKDEITLPYLATLITLLAVPDSNSCRKAIESLSECVISSGEDRRLETVFGEDVFRTALSLLLHQDACTKGLESEFVTLLWEVYSCLVIGQSVGAGSQTEDTSTRNLPRQILLSVPGVSESTVLKMEKDIAQRLAKKRRGEAFRDAMKSICGLYKTAVSGGADSTVVSKVEVLDLPTRLIRSRPSRPDYPSNSDNEVYNLSDLFQYQQAGK